MVLCENSFATLIHIDLSDGIAIEMFWLAQFIYFNYFLRLLGTVEDRAII